MPPPGKECRSRPQQRFVGAVTRSTDSSRLLQLSTRPHAVTWWTPHPPRATPPLGDRTMRPSAVRHPAPPPAATPRVSTVGRTAEEVRATAAEFEGRRCCLSLPSSRWGRRAPVLVARSRGSEVACHRACEERGRRRWGMEPPGVGDAPPGGDGDTEWVRDLLGWEGGGAGDREERRRRGREWVK